MSEPNDLIPLVCPLDATPVSSGPRLPQFAVPQALNPPFLTLSQTRWAPLSLLPDVLIFVFFLISPSQISLPFPGVINDLNFLMSIVTGMYPSNSIMDGSTIGSLLPVLEVSVAALGAVPQRGKLQSFIPAVPEECAPPMCALLLARVLLKISPVRFLFGSASLFLVPPLLVAFFL
jgi:hypothetical protein